MHFTGVLFSRNSLTVKETLNDKNKAVGAEDLVKTVYGLGYRLNHVIKEFKPEPILDLGKQQDILNAQETQF
ncbi:MAG: hypothetical protein KME11_11980 [Timaviella obliquedivisa GSE-PSE-MK23-08B]|jgi:DNA-binding winged helix-turn-helix (wHTH) protein|nr:hypothetical protein [Timaviella obliquedivisa GSE-PSE-MK23-08B]